MARNGPRNLAGKCARVGRVIKPDIVDPDTIGTQLLGEVAHRREDEHQLLAVMGDVSRFLLHLNHQDDLRGVSRTKVGQRGKVPCELIPKDEPDGSHTQSIGHSRTRNRSGLNQELKLCPPAKDAEIRGDASCTVTRSGRARSLGKGQPDCVARHHDGGARATRQQSRSERHPGRRH